MTVAEGNWTVVAIEYNGEPRTVAFASLAELLKSDGLKAGQRGVAVAVNGKVVAGRLWRSTRFSDGDKIEVVKIFSGG